MKGQRVLLLLIALTFATGSAGQTAAPVELTAEQDHRRLLDLLDIRELRPGADGRDPNAPNAANYDEAKANPYPQLPDPLRLRNGEPVTTPADWWSRRRPEIVEDFDREIYGRVPADVPAVRWEVVSTGQESVDGIAARTKALVGRADNSAYPAVSVNIELTLVTPANADGAVPVVIRLQPRTPVRRESERPTSNEQILARGWGYAMLVPTSVQEDNGGALTRGIIGLANKGQPRDLDDWGALRAWAWGVSRAIDYLSSDPDVDAKRLAVEGLSRYGKAALIAMAYEPRLSIAFVGSSGAGGAKLHRRNFGELVENLASSGEYHWMAGNFLKYAGPLGWNDLPVDAHELIALCAPRPVFIGVGSPQVEGGWIDARGMFMAAVAAGPVYRLLGARDLGTTSYPTIETALVGGELAFRQHAGGHTNGPNWPTFLDYAARYWSDAASR